MPVVCLPASVMAANGNERRFEISESELVRTLRNLRRIGDTLETAENQLLIAIKTLPNPIEHPLRLDQTQQALHCAMAVFGVLRERLYRIAREQTRP